MKKSFRKIGLALLFLLPAFLFAAPEGKTVLCTTFPIYLFTKNVTQGAKNVTVSLLVPAGTGCPHDYAVTPGDMRKLSAKNLILVMNGASLDDFFLKSVKKVNPAAFIIDSSRGIPLLPAGEEEHHHRHAHHKGEHAHEKEGHDHDHDHDHDGHDHGHDHGKAPGNPHLFASPFTARSVVRNIAEGLAEADPANGALYRKNAQAYGKKLAALCEKFTLASKDFRGKKIVTQHSVFDYLAFHSGLKVAGTLGDGHENALNAREMLRLVKKIRESGACVVFTEPQYSPRAAKTIGKECNIPVVQLDPVAGGPSDAQPDYYEKVMEKNLAAMKKVLVK